MRLNILLHSFSRHEPFGGLKVQYEYANRLSAIGHDVAIYHSLNFDRGVSRHPRSMAGLISYNVRRRQTLEWFTLDKCVRCRFVPRIIPRMLRRADATIIDSFLVAERLPPRTSRLGLLFHIVYEFPVWQSGTQDLRARLVRSLQREDIDYIATSAAVEEMLSELSVRPIAKITCGIDLPRASLIPSVTSRRPIIGFALRPEAYKGALDMLHAIPLIRAEHPHAHFEGFGRYDGDLHLPEGLEVHSYLDEEQLLALYRRCMIFVSPSHAEGWGLTAAEAMANGAAVVVTEDGGSRDFAVHRETALVVPPCKPRSIADAVSTLLRDDSLRSKIVAGGMRRCQEMSWERSVAQLDSLLSDRVGEHRLGAS